MYQYRIFRETWRALRFTLTALAGLLFLLLAGELIRTYHDLYYLHPGAGVAFNLAVTSLLLVIWVRYRGYRRRHAVLRASGLVTNHDSTQSELKRALKHLIKYVRRLARQPLLPGEVVAGMLQTAHDLQAALDHHPLRDDLFRGIERAHDALTDAAWRYLDPLNTRIIQAKATAILEDIHHPPFPVMPALVAVYHQATLVSEVVDLYLPRASTGEYARAMVDTWDVMTKGDFLRQGQRFYAGIEAGHPLGPAGIELGQAVSLVWITHCVGRVATHRLKTLHDWQIEAGIAAAGREVIPGLRATRDHLAGDGRSILMSIIRRHAPADGRDPRAYANEVAAALIKALDDVILTLSVTPRPIAPSPSPSLAPAPEAGDVGPVPGRCRLRHRHKRSRSLTQRISAWLMPRMPYS